MTGILKMKGPSFAATRVRIISPFSPSQQFAGHSDITTMRKYYLAIRSEDIVIASKLMSKILQGVKSK